MSKETMTWLNNNTLIGMTAKRGKAWHYRKDEQGSEPNHYEGFVPVAEVERRLFNWDAKSAPLRFDIPGTMDDFTSIDDDGNLVRSVTDETRQVIYHGGTGEPFGVFKQGYVIHQYADRLLKGLAEIVTPDGLAISTDSLGIGSAGLLRGGAQAWVQIERPDNVKTPEGVEFRSNLLACTSHDGSLATQYSKVNTIVVCDNTMEWALGEARNTGNRIKIMHTKYSHLRIQEAREALKIIVESADKFAADIAELCRIPVSGRQFEAFVGEWAPLPEKEGAARTRVKEKREKVTDMYRNDNRVAPWAGTAFGVLQLVNTYNHHYASFKSGKTSRAERNMANAISGKTSEQDQATLKVLDLVLASA
ncbi:DUF932 domain-containing protein [Nocardia sp. NPDC127526]|uniref:DUF932 domain-containing protein n=1 Tax=Nocardia sp. NPDC127526 TaxID=3345393 RepID=UPI00363597BC